MTSRYCYCPMTSKKLCRRVTLLERIRRHFLRQTYEAYPIGGYYSPVYPK